MRITVNISAGELIDKITILQIKSERIFDLDKLSHINHELELLEDAFERNIVPTEVVEGLMHQLKRVNETLWDIENEIRALEKEGNFGPRFIELARSVYMENDKRAELKKELNIILNSDIVEEKSYTATSDPTSLLS